MNSNFKFYLYKLVHTPPHKLLPKVYRKANSILSEKVLRYKDLNLKKANLTTFPKVAYSYVNINEISCSNINEDVATFIANMYMNHRFDLLGSGWVENNYNHTPLGVEGYCYDMALQITEYDTKGDWLKHVLLENSLPKSKSIWKHIDSSYSPIDWQLDFKSGFRWSAKKWYKDQVIGKNPGADVKVPWELGRLQHLPQMAIFAIVLPSLQDL